MLPIPFDNPDTYPGHTGVDFGQSGGTPFRASGPGVVTVRGYSARSGYTIWVRYDVGCEVGYVHMNSHRDCPAPGSRVVEGSFLGYVGRLGSNSTGNHLHVEVEGYSSTAGFWQWFTPNRVVGHATTSKDNSIAPAPIPFHKRPYARRKKKNMLALRIIDGRGLLGPKGKQRTYIVGGSLFVDTTDHATANDVSAIVQGYDSTGALMDTPNLTYRELYDYARGTTALTPDELEPYARAAGVSTS